VTPFRQRREQKVSPFKTNPLSNHKIQKHTMAKQRVITNYSHLRDAELDQKTDFVITSMTGNTNFTTPVPALAVVTTAKTAYQTALAAAQSRAKEEVEIKNQQRQELLDLLSQLATYVQLNGNSDPVIMLSSGFDITQADRPPVGPLEKPENFKMEAIAAGTLKLSCDKVDGADNYRFEYKETTAASWIEKTSSKRSITITGLISGKEYEGRVVAIGTDPSRIYSDVVTSFVL
jgi:hypothetical protein